MRSQQVYIAFLWCWGASQARLAQAGLAQSNPVVSQPATVISVGMAIAVLMWSVGTVLFVGLPDYYRQSPGSVPNFVSSILRRRIVLWFFMLVVSPSIPGYQSRCVANSNSGSPVLFPLCAIWPQLALPLVFTASACLDSQRPGPRLLHRRLVCDALLRFCLQSKPFLAATYLCHRSNMPPLVPNALGCFRNRTVRTLGRQPNRLCCGRTIFVALVGRPGLTSKCRIRSNTAAHPDPLPHLLHTRGGSNSGLFSDDCSKGVCA